MWFSWWSIHPACKRPWVPPPVRNEPGVEATHPQSSPQKWRKGDQTFKVILSYTVKCRPGPCAACLCGRVGLITMPSLCVGTRHEVSCLQELSQMPWEWEAKLSQLLHLTVRRAAGLSSRVASSAEPFLTTLAMAAPSENSLKTDSFPLVSSHSSELTHE